MDSQKPSPALVVALVALFVALAGTAWAAGLQKNSVKSKHIKDGQVLTQDIGDGAVATADLADGAVTSAKVANGSLEGEDFAAGELPAGATGPQGPGGSPDSGADILGKLAGVDGGGSGLDADLLDGLGSNAFALAGHDHDAAYVNEGQADSVNAAMVTNTTRAIQIPLRSFIECATDSGADLDFTSGADAFPDFTNRVADGDGFFIRFDDTAGTEDQDIPICTQMIVPPDATGGGSDMTLLVRASKNAQAGTTERLQANYGKNGSGAAASSSLPVNQAALTTYSLSVGQTLAPGDVLSLAIKVTTTSGTIDDEVNILGVELIYTSTQ